MSGPPRLSVMSCVLFSDAVRVIVCAWVAYLGWLAVSVYWPAGSFVIWYCPLVFVVVVLLCSLFGAFILTVALFTGLPVWFVIVPCIVLFWSGPSSKFISRSWSSVIEVLCGSWPVALAVIVYPPPTISFAS